MRRSNARNIKAFFACWLCGLLCAWWPHSPQAQRPPDARQDQARAPYSPSIMGALGLNTVPSARMSAPGTISAGLGTFDPYAHAYMGLQIAEPLYIGLRQSAEISGLNGEPRALYPGLDLKLRLLEETRLRPAVALGAQSFLGHRRMSAEYLALSKRYNNFDFTAGLGWGRMAGAGHITNPMSVFGGHFNKPRADDGENPATISSLLSGRKAAFFAGAEYFTPVDGLSLKFDWNGGDDFSAERTDSDYKPPARWGIGASYWALPWLNIGIGAQGTDKIMARLNVLGDPGRWRGLSFSSPGRATFTQADALLSRIAEKPSAKAMENTALENGIALSDAQGQGPAISGLLALTPAQSTPRQIGDATMTMMRFAGKHTEEISITPTMAGLHGPAIKLLRRDFENAALRSEASAAEIWRHTEFEPARPDAGTWRKLRRDGEDAQGRVYSLTLESALSLSEEDRGILHRETLLAASKGISLFGVLDSGAGFRLRAADNLGSVAALRGAGGRPGRGDLPLFAARGLSLDHLYSSFTYSLTPSLHGAITTGYLDEMFAGTGAEILYRPFQSRFAVGGEIWQAFARDPYSPMNLGVYNNGTQNIALNAWYDAPFLDLTFKAQAARYLAQDIGGTLSLIKNLDNGGRLEAFVTLSDRSEDDLFGGRTNAYQGLRFSMPLGYWPHIPLQAQMRVKAEPMARQAGQMIDNPLPLYDLTERFSKGHLARNWDDILPASAQP